MSECVYICVYVCEEKLFISKTIHVHSLITMLNWVKQLTNYLLVRHLHNNNNSIMLMLSLSELIDDSEKYKIEKIIKKQWHKSDL